MAQSHGQLMSIGATVVSRAAERGTSRDGAAVAAASNRIAFEGMVIAYGAVTIVHGLDLTIEPGEFLALIGPSGSGKTTVLRALAGFVRPQRGRIMIGSTDVTDLPPYARGIGMVVQNYALFPHMRVEDNVAFGLMAQRAPRDLVADRVRDCLRIVGMSTFGQRFPRELSGGQQQRVAIARALAIQPRVLLLDEPLSALDAQIRRNMVEELAALHHHLPGLTTLYVTHDQAEALTLGDRIAIMRDGRLSAHGTSGDLFRSPPNRFAAEFLGRANLLPVAVEGGSIDGRSATVRFAGTALQARRGEATPTAGNMLLCVRPHSLALAAADGLTNRLAATVTTVRWHGDQHALTLDAAGTELRLTASPMRRPPERGEAVEVFFSPEDAILISDGEAAR